MKLFYILCLFNLILCQNELPTKTIDPISAHVQAVVNQPTFYLQKAKQEAQNEVTTSTTVVVDDEEIFITTSTVYVDNKGQVMKNYKVIDPGLETLKNAGIGIGVVVVVVLIGIFILRKWKFSPTTRFRQKLENTQNFRQRSNESDTMFLRDLHAP